MQLLCRTFSSLRPKQRLGATALLLCCWGLLLSAGIPARHAYHATLTELRYNGPQKQLELSIKVFPDDLEKALSRGQPTPVSLTAPGPRATVLTVAYLRRTVEVKTAAGAPLGLQFVGMQQEKDAYWLYCKVPLPRTMAGIQLRQAMLLEVFPDQSNLVNLEAGTKKLSALFRNGHEQELLTW